MSETQTSAPVESQVASEVVEGAAVSESAAPEATKAEKVLADPKASPAEKKVAEKKLEKFKLKVFGKDVEEEIDLNDMEGLTRRFQKSAAADKSMQESAEIKKLAIQLIQDLKTNPRKVLSDPNLGLDVKKLAQEIINEEIAEMEKSPEQRELESLKKQLQEKNQAIEEREKQAKDAEQARVQKEYEVNLENQITAVLDISGLPKTPRTVARMADYMIIALKEGIKLEPKDIAPIVKNNTLSEFKEIITSLSDDQLDDFLGKEVLGRLRKKNIAKVKAGDTANSIKATGKSVDVKLAESKKEAPKDPKAFKKFFGI